eukprot:354058-Chlamydomonas_euryale.AAC.12
MVSVGRGTLCVWVAATRSVFRRPPDRSRYRVCHTACHTVCICTQPGAASPMPLSVRSSHLCPKTRAPSTPTHTAKAGRRSRRPGSQLAQPAQGCPAIRKRRAQRRERSAAARARSARRVLIGGRFGGRRRTTAVALLSPPVVAEA